MTISNERLNNRIKEHYFPSEDEEYENEEPVKCKMFGCGRTLTLEESRYSDYCIDHNKREYRKWEQIKNILLKP